MDIDYAKIDDRTLALRQWGIHPIPDEERIAIIQRDSLSFDARRLAHRQEYV